MRSFWRKPKGSLIFFAQVTIKNHYTDPKLVFLYSEEWWEKLIKLSKLNFLDKRICFFTPHSRKAKWSTDCRPLSIPIKNKQ
jgi:hypothetical protein